MYCGPLCLAYVHRKHNNELTDSQANKLANTTQDGTYVSDLMQALEKLNYRVRFKDKMRWCDLSKAVKAGNDVFVPWWSDLDNGNGKPGYPDGHWSVAVKLTKDTITLFDPDPEQEITMPKDFWMSKWYSYELHDGERVDFCKSAIIARPKKAK